MYLMSLLKLLNISFVSTYMLGSVLSRRGNQRRHNGLEATKKGLADILHPNPRVGAHSVLPHATEWTHESAPHTCFDREESTATSARTCCARCAAHIQSMQARATGEYARSTAHIQEFSVLISTFSVNNNEFEYTWNAPDTQRHIAVENVNV